LLKQKKRLADAERTLQKKTTKKAQEDQRVATDKIEWAKTKLSDLRRSNLTPEDERFFPGWYASFDCCHSSLVQIGPRGQF
jgi:hypothetical protein